MWGLLAILVGLVYGWASPGRQNKARLFRMGFLIGLVLAIVLAVLGLLTNTPAIGVVGGTLGIFLDAIIITLLFVLGVWLGDLIEGARRTPRV